MVHFTALALAVVAALTGAVTAKDCVAGEHICGWTLLSDEYSTFLPITLPFPRSIACFHVSELTATTPFVPDATKYRPLMRANLLGDRWVPDEDHMNNTLFECAGDKGEALGFPPHYCGGPDQCLPKGTGQCPDSTNACCASD